MPVFTSSIEVTADYPTIKPSLNLNFARSRSLDPRITFTRASVGTYVGRDGLIKTAGNDEARFDHDPDTLESLGLLIEESRTNFALDSNDYSINTTTINASITTNVITAPDGTLTADMITASAGNAQHGSTKNTTGLPINSVCSLSVFVKAGTNNYCRLDDANVTNWSASSSVVVNLTNGTIISGSGTVEPYPNGWYRITIYPTSNSTAGAPRGMWVWVCGSNGNSTYNAVGTETIHVWGAQLEAGAFPTSYIPTPGPFPTAGPTATRSADVASITGTNFSSWYNPTEVSVIGEYSSAQYQGNLTPASYPSPFAIDNNSTTRLVMFYHRYDNQLNAFVRSGAGDSVADLNIYSPATSLDYSNIKFGFATSNDGLSGIVNDGNIVTDATVNMPLDVNRVVIGGGYGANPFAICGSVKYLRFYTKKLSDTQLQQLIQ